MHIFDLEEFMGIPSNFKAEELIEYGKELSASDCEVTVGISHGCASLFIITDTGDAYFTYPIPFFEEFDVEKAKDDALLFCLDCDFPMTVTDVTLRDMPILLSGIHHADVDGDGEYFTVRIKTECMIAREIPEVMEGRVYLSEPVYCYADDYKRLVTDGEHNKLSGEDVRFSMKDEPSDYFVSECISEFECGTALTLFATIDNGCGINRFIGEGVLYRFDGRGECEVAVRILPEFTSFGYSGEILRGLKAVASKLGVSSVVARIHKDNERAIRLAKKNMDAFVSSEEDIVLYRSLIQ